MKIALLGALWYIIYGIDWRNRRAQNAQKTKVSDSFNSKKSTYGT
jgi:hypothetical protein